MCNSLNSLNFKKSRIDSIQRGYIKTINTTNIKGLDESSNLFLCWMLLIRARFALDKSVCPID